ncbi:MAG TPA: hypothetical protein VFR06_09390 [Gallionellaceae bacterium]|nr:hypothetical protein [Gallionellaceae bacterium]
MSFSYEFLLVLGVAGFYLYDSAMLLCFNELVLVESRGKWSFACPDSRWKIRRKHPYLPNPLAPHRHLFRQAWSVEQPRPAPGTDRSVSQFVSALRPFGIWAGALFAEMLIVLPLVIFLLGTGTAFFITLLIIYLTIVVALVLVYLRRKTLGLAGKGFSSLAFDALACPPFAINLVRKISLGSGLRLDPVEFARRHLEHQQFESLVKALLGRVDEELEVEDEDSPRGKKLRDFRNRLREHGA